MASDYMGWIKNEMEQLKTKLNVSLKLLMINRSLYNPNPGRKLPPMD